MKTFMVTVEERTIKTRQCEIQIKADTEAEAKILAKYHEIPYYAWFGGIDKTERPQVIEIQELTEGDLEKLVKIHEHI